MATATLSVENYAKLFLHAAKNFATPVCGLLLGSSADDKIVIEDVFPVFHNPLVQTVLDLAFALTNMFGENKQVIGVYFANDRSDTDVAPLFATTVIRAVQQINNGSCLTVQIKNSLMGNKDILCVNATQDGKSIQIITPVAPVVLNTIIDKLLAAKVHISLVDLEDHMDESTKDFTNTHIAAAVTQHSK